MVPGTVKGPASAAALLLALAGCLCAGDLEAKRAPEPLDLPQLEPLTPSAWLVSELTRGSSHRLSVERELPLLRRYLEPKVERVADWRGFWLGRYGPSSWLDTQLAWSPSACENRESLVSREAPVSLPSWFGLEAPRVKGLGVTFDVVPTWTLGLVPPPDVDVAHAAPASRCQPWERPQVVTVARYGGEHETFRLLECDGSVAIDALDHLSVLARPPGTPRPELPLPLEPELDGAVDGEWIAELRVLDPRLLWVVAALSSAFPGRVVYVISGYRRDAHDGYHHKGRALDLFVMGVKNEDLFRVCRKLKDVGCGYYPHNTFLHIDVRPPGSGRAVWIDASQPGEPTRYVDAWPGVVESGALTFGSKVEDS